MFYSKKSNITVSFSWIFMIIIGSGFLLLAYNVVDRYQENEEAKYKIELKQHLRNIFNNLGRSSGIEESSIEKIDNIFQNKEIEVLCESGFPILSIDSELDSTNNYLQNYPVFMTYINQKEVDNTYIAVESFRFPFKITNMMAIVSTKNLIILDSESDISNIIFEKFRRSSYNELNYREKKFEDIDSSYISQLMKENPSSVVFVSDDDRTIPINLDSLAVRANHLKVTLNPPPQEEIISFSYLGDLDENGDDIEYEYIDFRESYSLLTMAILSDPETFECSYNLIESTIFPIYDFYLSKTKYIGDDLTPIRSVCSSGISNNANTGLGVQGGEQADKYNDLEEQLVLIRDHIDTQSFNNIDTLHSLLLELQDLQEDLEGLDCEYVY